jgi:NADH dehydrogenase
MTRARTVLVTGASGFVGRRLLRQLEAVGWRTRALVHRRAVQGAHEVVSGDLSDMASLQRAVRGTDALVHLAALTHARRASRYRKVNVDGTGRLLRAADAGGVRRIVYVSTRAISAAGGAYSVSKLEAERLVAAAAAETVIVRLPEIYGAGGSEGIDDMIDRARRGAVIPIVGSGDDEMRPVHVDDAVAALVAALRPDAPPGAVYTLAGETMTVREVAETCRAVLDSHSRLVHVPVAVVRVASLTARVLPLPVYPDQLARLRAPKPEPSSSVESELEFAPRPLQQGLEGLSR